MYSDATRIEFQMEGRPVPRFEWICAPRKTPTSCLRVCARAARSRTALKIAKPLEAETESAVPLRTVSKLSVSRLPVSIHVCVCVQIGIFILR